MSPGAPGGEGRCRVGAVRSRRTFVDLRRSSARGRAGPLSVRFVEHPEWPGPAVAYAVGRAVGNAVVRTRLRRRLRAVVAEGADRLPSGAYLVSSGPGGPALEFEELKRAMSQALERATKRPSAARTGSSVTRENGP